MKRKARIFWSAVAAIVAASATAFAAVSCNDGMLSLNNSGENRKKPDRRQWTAIDNAAYVDFTVRKNDANNARKEDVLYALNNAAYKNGNSLIKIKAQDGTIEISSDSGRYNGRNNCQVYGSFAVDIKAASSDCLYMRRDPRREGLLMIDGVVFRGDEIPDLAVCLPLYGYSRNRIEVSSVMDGYIVMPSGTYWKQ